jgi:formyl-CoA transferase
MLMAFTMLGALHERNRTGQGRRLQVAMQDAMIHYMRNCFCTCAHRQAGAAQWRQVGWRQQRPGALPAKGAAPTTTST